MKQIAHDTGVGPMFVLLYGASGTGKTDFCGQLGGMPSFEGMDTRVLIIDIDKGSMTLRTSPRVRPYQKNVTVVSFEAFKDLNEAYVLAQKNDPAAWSKALNMQIDKPFTWIVWDSWSEIQWNMHQKLRKDKDMLGSTLDFRKNLEIQHWGMLTDLNKMSIEALRDVRVNQVFVMLETLSKDEVTGTVYGGPSIHGKLVNEMPGYFNIVMHSYIDPMGKYHVTTAPKGRWPAKSRLKAGEDLVNPKPQQLLCL